MSFSAKTVRSFISIVLIISLFMLASCTGGGGPVVANKEKLPEYESEFDSTKFYSIIHKSEKHSLDSRSNLASGTYYIDARAPKENADAQQYQIVAIADNEYMIISKLFGKAAKFSSAMETEKLTLDNNRQISSQVWQIVKVDDEHYKIINSQTKKALALVNGKIGQLPEKTDTEESGEEETNEDAKLWKIKEAFAPKFAEEPEWVEEFNSSDLNTEIWNFNPESKRSESEVEADRGPEKNKPNRLERSSNDEKNLSMMKKTAVLTLNKEEDSQDITGVSLNTKGNKEFKYGRIEVWAKLPAGEGAQASLYLACDPGEWTERSEFNVFEFYGGITDGVVITTAHYKHQGDHVMTDAGQFEISRQKMADKFHLFAIEWDETQIRYYVDGIMYGALPFNNASLRDAFQRDHYIGINISAMAPGDPTSPSPSPNALNNTYPQYLQIDSIKYYPLAETAEE